MQERGPLCADPALRMNPDQFDFSLRASMITS